MEQVAELKRTWELAPVLQIIQKIPESYCLCLHQSTDQFWWRNELWFKRYIQKCTLSHVLNTHHEVTVLINREMLKIQNLKCFENGT